MSAPTDASSSRRRKFFALVAGGALIVTGVGYTLAAWTDTEWVFGGAANGTPALGTSRFAIEQNVNAPFASASFVTNETNPGQALGFEMDGLALSPGDAVYADVALRTTSVSAAGDLTLQPAVPSATSTAVDAQDALWNALQLRVATSTSSAAVCDDAAFDAPGSVVVDGPLASTGATVAQTLAARSGSVQVYCFEVSLPTSPTLPEDLPLDGLQGRTVAPAWQFIAESD
jgi:hypothetical protein